MRHAFAAAALLLAACDGPLLFAEIQIPDLQVTLPSQSFPAVNASLPADWCDPTLQTDPPCLALDADYDIGAQLPAVTEKGVSYELRITSCAITLSAVQQAGSPPDLSGIESATIRVIDDPATGSGAVIASYVKPPGAAPTTIAVTGNANLDLAPYLVSGVLPVRVEVVVSNGTAAFDADITAGFSVVVNVDWGSYL